MPDFKEKLSQKTTDELFDILKFHKSDYKTEAIEDIKEILFERGNNLEEVNQAENDFSNILTPNKISKPSRLIKIISVIGSCAALAFGQYLYRTSTNNYFKHNEFYWTKENKHEIKKALLISPELSKVDSITKERFCTCYINELENMYPDFLPKNIPKIKEDSLINKCIVEVKNQLN